MMLGHPSWYSNRMARPEATKWVHSKLFTLLPGELWAFGAALATVFVAIMLAQHNQRVLNAAITDIKRGEAILAMHRAQPHHPYAPCNRCAACDCKASGDGEVD